MERRGHLTALIRPIRARPELAVIAGFAAYYILFFAPVLFTDRLLGLEDGMLYCIPALYGSRALWTPLLFSGYPIAADPQMMLWYPLAWLFSWGPGSWNGFVVIAYFLASVLTFGYVRKLSGSLLASMVAGLVYGMSGFLMLHTPHPQMVHSLAWLPLSVWSIEEIRSQMSRRWIALLGISIALSALAGHPQMFLYAFILVGCYALARARGASLPIGKYFASVSGGLVLGLAAASILLLPMLELATRSVRSQMSFQLFVSVSLRPDQLPALVFPLLFGGRAGFGPTLDVQGYTGLLPVALAFLGVLLPHRSRVRMFWLCGAALTLLLALGASTPLARWTFAIPGLNLLRGSSRHFAEFSFAISVLAGLGIAAMERLPATDRIRKTNIASLVLIAIVVSGFATIFALSQSQVSAPRPDPVWGSMIVSPTKNPAIGLQLVFLAIGLLALQVWARRPTSIAGGVLIGALLLDLGHFAYKVSEGGFMGTLATRAQLDMPSSLVRYKTDLSATGDRLLPSQGLLARPEAAVPNLSRLWDVRSAGGYNPLILQRYSDLLGMTYNGSLPQSALAASNRSLDVLSVKYLMAPTSIAADEWQSESYGMKWAGGDLRLNLGSDCNQTHPATLQFSLPAVNVTEIGLVSSLACSGAIPQGADVIRVVATALSGETETLALKTGIHTSEWAWDRNDVQRIIQHGRAPVFRSYNSADEKGKAFQGHQYAAVLPFHQRLPISELRFEWAASGGTASIRAVSLKDRQTGRSYALNDSPGDLLVSHRWETVENFPEMRVLKNTQALPRAWLVSKVKTLRPQEILQAIHESKLPGGEEFDPSAMALVEEPVEGAFGAAVKDAVVRTRDASDSRVEVEVMSGDSAFLVLSDAYYPGWQASIDGRPARVFQTNYVSRGVVVPAGSHRIVFDFQPTTFYVGAVLTCAAILVLLFLLL